VNAATDPGMAEVLVTGASSGIGLLTAVAFGRAGDHVIAGVRDPSSALDLDSQMRAEGLAIDVVALDVTDATSIDRFVEHALQTRPSIDVVINNAGVAFIAAVEDSDDRRTAIVMDTNFYGPLRLIRGVLPYLRTQGHGHIINVSSLRAKAGAPFAGVYAASKAALDALSVSLASEIAPFGLHVTIVEAGSFHTAIDQKFVDTVRQSPGYPGQAEAHVLARNRAASDDAHRVADAIVQAAHTRPPPFRIQIPTSPKSAVSRSAH
jgi:NAD(P)-dependent dehydrogenase (short-subunit alcohol dehydrogenase family)